MFDYLFDLFDGVHIYFQGEIPLTILDILNRSNALKAAVKEVNFAATVNPGFDNTPWYEEWNYNHLVIDRQEGDFYRRLWEAAVTSDPDWILLTSFNEWHEGTEVEPSEEYGDLYLQSLGSRLGSGKKVKTNNLVMPPRILQGQLSTSLFEYQWKVNNHRFVAGE